MKIKGFTLLELLITMVLFFALSLIGIASHSYLLQKNEQETLIDTLRTALQYAKIQAMVLGSPVSLHPLDAVNWSNGIALTVWNKKTKSFDVLYQWQWHHPHWCLDWVGVRSTQQIIVSNNPAQAMSNGRFILMNKQTHQHLAIIVNRLGRVRVDTLKRGLDGFH